MSELRVFNLGLPKSGTTTLATALKEAGMKVADHKVRRFQTKNTDQHGKFVGDILYGAYFRCGDPLADLDGFGAVAEASYLLHMQSAWPQMDYGLIDAVRAHHPGVKFVATNRGAAATAKSMGTWTNMEARLIRADIPGLPRGYGGTIEDRVKWIDGHHAWLRRVFAGRDDFLELDVAAPDAQARLADFLGITLPWWGKANENKPAAAGGKKAQAT